MVSKHLCLNIFLDNKTGPLLGLKFIFGYVPLFTHPMSSEFVLQTKHGGKDSKSGVITHLSIEKFEVSAYGHSVDNV